jgi:hypothetical protein
MSNELYTIDKTPSTDLEKFQYLRIEALENRVKYLEAEIDKAKEILTSILDDASEIEVNDYKDFSA